MRASIPASAALSAFALFLALALSGPAQAQGTARLYGFEKAAFVNGTVSLAPDRGEVVVRGFSARYREPMALMIARSFDPRGAVKVGELAAGFTGDASFPLPAGTEGMDTVLLLLPADGGTVGLGLFR